MGAELKKLNNLSKQVEQYESHLGILKRDIQIQGDKRDAVHAEIESAQQKLKEVQAECEIERSKLKQTCLDEEKRISDETSRLQEERNRVNTERNQLISEKDALEFVRRDLENDKRRIAGFIQIVDQAIKAWR